uniref:Uncharacterized protein n=1 Tax=Glycine max TaxID=3847 RepID=C6TFY6_SOYBN|nr:unknown [Glycine max]
MLDFTLFFLLCFLFLIFAKKIEQLSLVWMMLCLMFQIHMACLISSYLGHHFILPLSPPPGL